MAGVGDILKLDLQGNYQGQTWLNVFFYRIEDAPTEGYLDGLATEFGSVVLSAVAATQQASVNYDSITITNIFTDEQKQYTGFSPASGGITATNSLPSIISASVKLVRSNTRVRHGRKSLLGFDEGDMNSNLWTSSKRAAITTAAQTFADTLTAGGVDVFKPVIVGRVLETPPPPEKPFYRLPNSLLEMGTNWAYIVDVFVSPYVRTMNSRRPD